MQGGALSILCVCAPRSAWLRTASRPSWTIISSDLWLGRLIGVESSQHGFGRLLPVPQVRWAGSSREAGRVNEKMPPAPAALRPAKEIQRGDLKLHEDLVGGKGMRSQRILPRVVKLSGCPSSLCRAFCRDCYTLASCRLLVQAHPVARKAAPGPLEASRLQKGSA